ncbi:MAG: hypothetical protein HRT63_13515 [Erythrobacter sp.]|nr:hypothetical protein [Erythrobacter sp.]
MDEKKVATTEEEMRAMIAEAAISLPDSSLQFDEQGRALPPWKVFPDYARLSMGWRMGGGEDYWYDFRQWYHLLPPAKIQKYQSTYPTPEGWEDFYEVMTPMKPKGNENSDG